jgi:CheY-like chemotaxis protein
MYASGLDTDMMAQPTLVIVVDDNAGLLKSVARLLAHHGIDSRTFASAEALIESGSAQTATCLLLDIHLGGISGIELQRRLAASGSKCPVIFMTANDDEATRNEAVDAGCIAYLRKPFASAGCHWESCGLTGAAQQEHAGSSRPSWVNRVGLTVDQPLPVYPRQRTSPDRPGSSVSCQYRKYRTRRCGVGRSSGTILADRRGTDVWMRAPWDVRQRRYSVPCRTRR